MAIRSVLIAFALGTTSAAVGAVVAVGYPVLLALAAAIAVTASCCVLLDRRDLVVGAGVASYCVLGVATLVGGVPPSYPPAIGVALLASAALAVLGLEAGSRAGATIHAAMVGDGSAEHWRRSAKLLARAIDRWQGTRGDPRTLVVVPLVAVGTHVGTVLLGLPPTVQAASLVPVALVGFVVFPLVDVADYVAPGTDGTVISAASPARVSVEAVRDLGPDLTTTVGDTISREAGGRDDGDASRSGGESSATGSGSASSASASGSAPSDPARSSSQGRSTTGSPGSESRPETGTSPSSSGSPTATSASATSSSTDASATDTVRDGVTAADAADSPDASNGSAGTSSTLADCQNCGSGCEDREPRFVVSQEAFRVVLCEACHARRVETTRSLDDCEGDAVRGAVADETACAACGAAGVLEAHPIVPLDAGGHRHPNNVLALCPSCHAAVEEHVAVSGDGTAPRQDAHPGT